MRDSDASCHPRRKGAHGAIARSLEWPLPRTKHHEPRILRAHSGDKFGVDVGYLDGPENAVMPVLASWSGRVVCAIESNAGSALSIAHGQTWRTHYMGLSRLRAGYGRGALGAQRVRAGDVIGYAVGPLLCIGFELWRRMQGQDFVAVDPRLHLVPQHPPAHRVGGLLESD